ncbi:metal-sensing transcriptional repressor [Microaceticoccus formicicus]|uniref:metal-sensing transcriptional repressor n=1 Tax=Microaceticoccus formicicus TaxID=3118105 RepID=UPI003CD01A66|nr:metal-sensing transcriptional repressor [Peptoniphilaceae bacterium AMB_02]
MKSDPDKVLRRLKTARGQIEGIIRMVEEDRYCIDISNQLLATEAIIKSVNKIILHDHLNHCVLSSIESDNQEDKERKIQEIQKILDKFLK